MDGEGLFERSARAGGCGGCGGGAVAQSGGGSLRGRDQHGDQLGSALPETGSVAPGKIGGYRQKAIRGEDRDWLLKRIKEKDFTLRGLVAEFAAERGLKVDYKTMWTFVHDEGLSFKKKRRGQRARAS